MKNIKTYKEFKEPTTEQEELAQDFRNDKRSDKDSIAALPFNAKDIESIQAANSVNTDKSTKLD